MVTAGDPGDLGGGREDPGGDRGRKRSRELRQDKSLSVNQQPPRMK